MKQLAFAALRLLGINRLFRRRHRGRIKVLLYHHVMLDRSVFGNAVTVEEFDAHLRHLKRHYNLLSIDQEGHWRGYDPHRVNVLITFDDGFIGLVDGALPILMRHQVPALFFLISDCARAGEPPAFASRYAKAGAAELRTLGPAEIRTLVEAGMTIGSHSQSHRDFRGLSDEEALNDARGSRHVLEELCGAPVTSFAFPWGHHRPGQDQLLSKVYDRVFLTRHGFCGPDDRVLPRNEVMTALHLEAAASGALDFLRGGRR